MAEQDAYRDLFNVKVTQGVDDLARKLARKDGILLTAACVVGMVAGEDGWGGIVWFPLRSDCEACEELEACDHAVRLEPEVRVAASRNLRALLAKTIEKLDQDLAEEGRPS